MVQGANIVLIPYRGIEALQHCHPFREISPTIISPRGHEGAKKEKSLLQNVHKQMYTYINFLIIYISKNLIIYISKNLIGYGIFRKHPIS